MNSFPARLGQFDSRRAARTIWNTGKRKRPEHVCAECRAREALKQKRGYSDDAARLDGASYLFPGGATDAEDSQQRWGHSSRARKKDGGAWGLRSDEMQQETNSASAFFTQHHAAARSAVLSRTSTHEGDQVRLWEKFEAVVQDTDVATDASQSSDSAHVLDAHELPSITDDVMLDLDYHATLATALPKGEADLVVRCLYTANQANDLDWLGSIPATTFSEIIRLLEPSNFIAKLANAHIELSAAMVTQLGIAPMRRIAFEYALVLRQIIAIRRSAGVSLSLDDYTVLLRSARDLGNQRMGASLFESLLNDGHTPTTSCYNYYMSSVVWNGVHLAGSRHKVRVVPFNMLGRKQTRRNARLGNYRVGAGGVREVAMKIFNDMLAHGAIADEESFRILITASAREGDVDMVKSMLKNIWNINVSAILEGQDDASIAPKALPEHSPLRPTTALLFTIAHAFGINNDIPAALRTVDFVARHYNITITEQVWSQLFEWTFVLSSRRGGRNKTDGAMTGQLPPESLLSLWDTMTGPPYHIQPSIGMYNYLIKSLFQRSWTPKLLEKMQEGIDLYTEHRYAVKEYSRRLREATQSGVSDERDQSIEQLRRDWEYADLIRQRDRFWAQRWLRLLLGSFRNWHQRDHQQQLFCQELPPLLWRWSAFAPSIVKYETPTGFVELAIRTDDEMLQGARVRAAIHEKRRELAGASKKYVGNTWVLGREHRLPRRLLGERPELPDSTT